MYCRHNPRITMRRRCRADITRQRHKDINGLPGVSVGAIGCMWLSPQLFPIIFRHFDPEMLGCFLDIRKRKIALGVRHPGHLIKSRESILDMMCVRKGLFSLFRKCECAIRQSIARCGVYLSVNRFRFPGCLARQYLPPLESVMGNPACWILCLLSFIGIS